MDDWLSDEPQSDVELAESSGGRMFFVFALLLSCLVGAAALLVTSPTEPESNERNDAAPVVVDDPNVVEDEDEDADGDGDRGVEVDAPELVVEQAVGLASSVAATLELESYEVTVRQEMPSFEVHATSVVVGQTARSVTTLATETAETLTVDGRLYELDGSTWYLKPVPAELLVYTPLSEVIGLFAELPARELDRSDGVVRLEILCDELDSVEVPADLRQICPDVGSVVASVDEASGRLSLIRVEGTLEISPGFFEEGFVETSISSAEDRPVFEPPSNVDTSRAECIADAMGFSVEEVDALAAALDHNTTQRNGQIYQPCGFPLYPPGWDFRD